MSNYAVVAPLNTFKKHSAKFASAGITVHVHEPARAEIFDHAILSSSYETTSVELYNRVRKTLNEICNHDNLMESHIPGKFESVLDPM
ncbi:hypothetical protein I5P74_05720 [Serratia ureilytica]|uniref:hypothetical protein n=1 Tax=Serratia ureilytica TaxID=300181 RepID=UPI0018D8A6F1|nr:hypothetical protein [Serratia ureilytica]MBH3107470.1 hypothetical protein [Serratia ureilytica]